jgi:type IV secretory pathway TrbD component
VAGLSLDGELSGKVVVTAPKNLVFYAGDSVELLVGGKIIETKEIKEQNSAVSFVLDTTKLVNGKTIVAVRVTRANGEISTYSSNVTIANGKISAASGAVKRSWLSLTLGILSFIAIAVAIVVLVRWYIQRRQFNEMHNTLDYTYVQPENPYYATAGASMAILVGLSTVLLLGVTQSNAANIGYIYSVAQASGVPTEYSLENDPSTDLDFVRMTDTADNADPGQNVDTGHDTTPSPTPTPTHSRRIGGRSPRRLARPRQHACRRAQHTIANNPSRPSSRHSSRHSSRPTSRQSSRHSSRPTSRHSSRPTSRQSSRPL